MTAAAVEAAVNRFLEAVALAKGRAGLAGPEQRLQTALAKAFRRQGAAFLKRFASLKDQIAPLSEAIKPSDWEALLAAAFADTEDLFGEPLDAETQAALLAGGEAATAAFGEGVALDFSLEHPRAVAYLRTHGAALVSGINDTTRDQVRTIIADGVEQQRSYSQIAAELKARFTQFAVGVPQQHLRSRAELIAVTETATAYETASRAVIDDLTGEGQTWTLSWLSLGDDRVCDLCQSNVDAGEIAVGEVFPTGDEHPPAHPGDRCTVVYSRAGASA